MAGVAAHRGPDVDVSTAVHDGCHLPVRLVNLVASFLKLNLGHCKDRNQLVTGEPLSVWVKLDSRVIHYSRINITDDYINSV